MVVVDLCALRLGGWFVGGVCVFCVVFVVVVCLYLYYRFGSYMLCRWGTA